MNIIKHKVYPETMLNNPEILDVDFWMSDGSFCRARLALNHKELMDMRPSYDLAYILNDELKCSNKDAVSTIEKYLHGKRYELVYFWVRAIFGVIGLGILLALFLIL